MKWEYNTFSLGQPLSAFDLNSLGNDCWELTGFQVNTIIRNMQNGSSETFFHYIFKRPKP